MNKISLAVAVFLTVGVSTVFAANTNLTNGGFGQRASDTSSFGFAICNQGSIALTTPVPVTITANGLSVATQSPASIAPHGCAYAYVSYRSLSMAGGHSYLVTVAISGGGQDVYNITVPGTVLGESIVAPAAAVADQNRLNLLASQVQLLQNLLAKLKALLGQ